MPNSFVFALGLSLITALSAVLITESTLMTVLEAWYNGFWLLLEFGMQMILILVTGLAIALSPAAQRGTDRLSKLIKSPRQVYLIVVILGLFFALVSWGWIAITAVLARSLAMKVRGVHYPYLIACVYFSGSLWVGGLSSTIPLLLNTDGNYLIESGIVASTISTSMTLGSSLNFFWILISLILVPLLFLYLIPRKPVELQSLMDSASPEVNTIREEAASMNSTDKTWSDRMNNSALLIGLVAVPGFIYLAYYVYSYGLDLNLNIMIFLFLMVGLVLHRSPIRYGLAMKRSSANISGIVLQFPFYAGIMGMMIYTGLGETMASWMASAATVQTFPLFAYLTGAFANFAIPSAGGEFAVIGPSVLEAVKDLGASQTLYSLEALISRASMSIAYGETMTNAVQPFYLLLVIPVMGAGTKLQARDIMGFLLIPFALFFMLGAAMVLFFPM